LTLRIFFYSLDSKNSFKFLGWFHVHLLNIITLPSFDILVRFYEVINLFFELVELFKYLYFRSYGSNLISNVGKMIVFLVVLGD
jgi:hypothetical protein